MVPTNPQMLISSPATASHAPTQIQKKNQADYLLTGETTCIFCVFFAEYYIDIMSCEIWTGI